MAPMHADQMAIVKSLVTVAWADGEFAQAERDMIEALISAFGANEAQAEEIRFFASEKKTLGDLPIDTLSADDRRVLLQHAVVLALVDGKHAAEEKAHLDQLIEKLGIAKDEAAGLVAIAEARAKRHIDLLKS